MFGSSAKNPTPQPFIPPPPYQQAPAYNPAPPFQNYDPQLQNELQVYIPQVESAQGIVGQALGSGVSPDLSNYGTGWLSLKENPTDSQNVNRAEQRFLQLQGDPQLAQDESNLVANGQGGSSYEGAYLGQERAMNNLNAWNAGIAQQNSDFNNVLNARNSLYSGPIALAANQNAASVARGLGIAGLDMSSTLAGDSYNLSNNEAANSYNLANNQGLNNYNLQGALAHNNYNQGIFGIQQGAATAQRGQNLSFLQGMTGIGAGLINGSGYTNPGGGGATGIASFF